MNPLEELMTRSIDDGTDRLGWLRARQGRITASMVGKLLNRGPGERRRLLEESFQEPVEIVGNKYIDRGHEREPVIAEWIGKRWPGFAPNTHLFGAKDNARFAATPDCLALSPEGDLVLGEIKTSKYDRHPIHDGYFGQTGYMEQMQWQMHVCGANLTLFVWEQHDDDWEDGPTPLHDEPRHYWVERDDEMITRLIETAELALAERDRMAAEIDVDEPVDNEIALLAAEVLEARKAKAAAEARLKAPWTKLLETVSDREEFSAPAGRAMVTWSNRTSTETQPDEAAALAAPVEDLDGVTGADLYDDLERAREAWEKHRAKFTRTVERQVQKLTVTEPKPKPSAAIEGEF